MTDLAGLIQVARDPLLEATVEMMERHRVPGAAVGVLHGDHEYEATHGVTSVHNPLPINEETLFLIASLTKTTVATAAMRLVETRQLELDAPVQSYLPDLRLMDERVARRVTLRHLFTHTGGWSDTVDADPDLPLSQLPGILHKLPQITPLGGVWSYSNSGVCLAGRVLEVVTGQTFEKAIQGLVLDPLQMNGSHFNFGDMITRRTAIGHIVDMGVTRPVMRWVDRRWRRPSVGLASSLKDLLRYARFHLSDGTAPDGSRLLAPESLWLMQSPLTPDRPPARALGLTWFIDEMAGARIVSLLGSTAGISCQLLMAPQRRFAVVVLANVAGHDFDREMIAWALKHYLDLVEETQLQSVPEDALFQYAGKYTSPYGLLEIRETKGGLLMHMYAESGATVPEGRPPRSPEPLRLAFFAQDSVIVLGPRKIGVRGQFLRDSQGAIVWFRFPTIIWERQQ